MRPDQAQLLTDADRWNEYADRMNAKAIAAGIVDAEIVAANRRRSQLARAELLARWQA